MISFPKSIELFGSESAQGLKILTPDEIQGTIGWDDEKDGKLPKLVTGKRSYTWDELGMELMTYEGYRISIKMG